MRYKAFSLNKLRAILDSRGLRDRDLVKMMYGSGSHQTFKTIFSPQFGVQKLVDVCNAMDIPMDCLFETYTDTEKTPSIQGSNNNVNSTVINNDVATLKSENEALKLLIKEKDSRIEDLKRNLDKVIELAQFGQNHEK